MWHVASLTRSLSLLPVPLRSLHGQGLRALRSLGFFMLGWREARRQHDVAEFLDHLLPKVLGHTGHEWSSRELLPEGVVHRLVGPLNQCLTLPAPSFPTPDLQELVNRWHHQETMHALQSSPRWLFLQLPRFAVRSGRVRKNHQPFLMAGELMMPVFSSADSLDVAWCTYRICAYIRHHGTSPRSGHYTVVLSGSSQYLMNDDADPKPVDEQISEDTSVSMYVLVMHLASDDDSSFSGDGDFRSSSSQALDTVNAHGGHTSTTPADNEPAHLRLTTASSSVPAAAISSASGIC